MQSSLIPLFSWRVSSLPKWSRRCNLQLIPLFSWGVMCLPTMFLAFPVQVLSEQGGIPLTSSTPPPSPRMVSFDWNDLVEPHLPSSAPFQIRVEVNSKNIYRCIVDEGASASILSSSVWKVWDLPSLCLLRMSCWLLTDVLVNIWGFFLSFLSR
jgi:hypothetical protein